MLKSCDRCTRLPDAIPEIGTLYLAPPEAATAARIREACSAVQAAFEEDAQGIFKITLGAGVLTRLCRNHLDKLNSLELKDTRCIVLADGAVLTPTDFANTRPLSAIVALSKGVQFSEILRDKRLTTHFQPIVPTNEPAKPFAYECLLRGIDEKGAFIPPYQLFSLARDAEMLFQLDRAARISAIDCARENDIHVNLFINFNPTAIYDPSYCLNTTVAAMRTANLRPDQVVFEVVESDEVNDKSHLLEILQFYRANGFRVALDDLGAGYSSLNLLHRLQPDFIKLDMELIRNIDSEPFKARITANLLSLARELDIRSIAEGVETVAEWEWLRANGAEYCQGYLFARPGSPPPAPETPPSF